MNAFYGNPVGINGDVSIVWKKNNLVLVPVPYKMVLAWDRSQLVRNIWFHKKASQALATALKGIWAIYRTQDAIEKARMDLFGGSFTYRRILGSHRLSCHAWGCAIDIDPEHNAMGSHTWSMPNEVVDIFEAQGATWGGHWHNRPDAMHFQYANV